MTELRPCPFCGGESIKLSFNDYNSPVAYCRNCFAEVTDSTRTVEIKDLIYDDNGDFRPDIEPWIGAVKKWNTRA